jgi:hypothetical protein
MTDLFGVQEPERVQLGELFEDVPQGLRQALAELREASARAEVSSRLRPRDRRLQQRAAAAKREYLQMRDHARSITAEEIAAERIASGDGVPLPTDNRELF